jgi:hypothetical protein
MVMNRINLLFVPLLVCAAAASASSPDLSRLSNDDLLSSDKPILTVAETQKAVEEGTLNCQTDDVVGTRIDKRTVCDLAQLPYPTGSRYRFILTDDGLIPTFCSTSGGCTLPPSVVAGLSSLQRLHLKAF